MTSPFYHNDPMRDEFLDAVTRWAKFRLARAGAQVECDPDDFWRDFLCWQRERRGEDFDLPHKHARFAALIKAGRALYHEAGTGRVMILGIRLRRDSRRA
jgi:hypothetical protein